MDINNISQQLTNYVKEETIQLIHLIFDDSEINKLYPDYLIKNNIIEKYFKINQKMIL